MIKSIVLGLVAALTWGCALTAPDGSRELLDDIKRDKATLADQSAPFAGRPIFVKVRAYPRIENANIHGKHWIFLKVGNEALDIKKLLGDLKER